MKSYGTVGGALPAHLAADPQNQEVNAQVEAIRAFAQDLLDADAARNEAITEACFQRARSRPSVASWDPMHATRI